MKQNLDQIAVPVLEIIDSMQQMSCICRGNVEEGIYNDAFYSGMDDILKCTRAIKEYLAPYLGLIRSNSINAVCNNIIDAIIRFTQAELSEKADPLFTYINEIQALIFGLYDAVEFYFQIHPNPVRLNAYYQQRQLLCTQARELDVTSELEKIDLPHEITIVIMTYNLREYFAQCFESILKYTDFSKFKVQLIVFDHGSTDDTLEYLKDYEHLPFLRIHHCKENIKSEHCFAMKYYTWHDSKYTLIVANDTIATANYLENLMTCIKSDDRIAWICPSMCNTSNNQAIPVQYNTINEMHEFAKNYNKSDPSKWEELCRLIPVFSLYNNVCKKAVGHEDPTYYEFLFGDDDISRAFVRAGFRMIVCKDTYIHHYPSMTVSAGGDYAERLLEMRALFYQKFQYDAWSGLNTVCRLMDLRTGLTSRGKKKVLFIEPEMGIAVAYLRTILHQNNISLNDLEIVSVGKKECFQVDMQGYSHLSALVKKYEELHYLYEENTFDMVIIPYEAENLTDTNYGKLFRAVRKVLKPGGIFHLAIKNIYSDATAFHAVTNGVYIPEDDFNYIIPKPMSFLQIKHMRALLNNAGFSQINITGITNCVNLEALNEPLIRMLEPLLAEHNPKHSIIYYVIAAIK